mmetsp:Transcript_43/g.89  ORF Transcript_43/g.89 Transcript_43/m.89 type:complete len:88 (-) Transcript_43:165-428(-)
MSSHSAAKDMPQRQKVIFPVPEPELPDGLVASSKGDVLDAPATSGVDGTDGVGAGPDDTLAACRSSGDQSCQEAVLPPAATSVDPSS